MRNLLIQRGAILGMTLAFSALWTHSAWAQNYSITSAVTAAYELDGTPLGFLPNINGTVGQPYVYQVDFTFHASGFTGNQRGFGSMSFTVDATGAGLMDPVGLPVGYQGSAETVDSNGASPGGIVPLWADNSIFASNIAVAAIEVIASPHPDDPRPLVGQGPGTLLGSLFVRWDGANVGSVETNILQAAYARADNGQLAVDDGIILGGSSLVFGVPEPTTVALVGLSLPAIVWLTRRRKRAKRV